MDTPLSSPAAMINALQAMLNEQTAQTAYWRSQVLDKDAAIAALTVERDALAAMMVEPMAAAMAAAMGEGFAVEPAVGVPE